MFIQRTGNKHVTSFIEAPFTVLCVFRYLSVCMQHYWICWPKSSASVKCHCSAQFVNVTDSSYAYCLVFCLA